MTVHRMFTLKQGRRTVADFSVDFWILTEETGWDEKALCGELLNSLNEQIKCELATKELPKTLDALIYICVWLGDLMHEYGKRTSDPRWADRESSSWTICHLQNGIWWNTSNLTMRNSSCTWAMPSSPSLIREEGMWQVLPVGIRDILQIPVLPS